MNAPLADALQDCLEAIEHGASVDAALARHSARQSELRPLLKAARIMRHHRPRPAAAFRARVQVALAEQDLTSMAWAHVANPRPDPCPSAPRRGWWRPLATRLAGAALSVAVLFTGTVLASANTRPGDLLYPIRRGVEQIRETTSAVLAPVAFGLREWAAPLPAPAAADDPAPSAAARDPRASRSSVIARPAPFEGVGDTRRQVTRGGDAPDGTGARDDGAAGLLQPGLADGAAANEPSGPGGGSGMGDPGAHPSAAAEPAAATDPLPATPTPASGAPMPPARDRAPADLPVPPEPPPPETTPDTSAAAPTAVAPALRGAPTAAPVQVGSGPFAILRGTIVRDDGTSGGTPLVGYLVTAYVVVGPRDEPSWWQRWSDWTNEKGEYQVSVPPGRYKVFSSPNPYQWQQGRWYPGTGKFNEAEVVTLVAGETRESIDIRFDRLPPWLMPWRGF